MAPTQDALYSEIDLELSWSERELPERVRTKHVHRLHPYLGKYVPQLVEALLARHVRAGGRVLDPFAGSGTTLVQALESGHDALGVDVAAFNCLLMQVKTADYNLFGLEHDIRDALSRQGEPGVPSAYVRAWYEPRAAEELLAFRSLIPDYEHADVLRVVLARAARSARRTTHFDLDFPRDAAGGRVLVPQAQAHLPPGRGGRRASCAATRSTRWRGSRSSRGSGPAAARATVVHGDARETELGGPFDGIVTSPPYPGLIDYHEQHRCAYEILGLDDRRALELGAAASGTSRAAVAAYADGIAMVVRRSAEALRPGARVVIVVHDRRGLYDDILARAGLELELRYRRHVNRRTGRRAGEFYEDVLVARPA